MITGESLLDLGGRQTVLHSYRFEGKDMLSLSPRHQATPSYVVAETTTRKTKHHTRRVGELRFIMPAGPEELTLQALSPEQRGYRVFIHGQAGQEGRQDRQDMYKNMDIMFLYMIK